ncbi:MAG: hypothetical protein NXI18_15435 [Alphaproteobacteria bacterium]|nr:hypothetical protein [Alphaproteobacteria bacterium]
MTGRWQDLDMAGRRTAGTVFAALDVARELADAGGAVSDDAVAGAREWGRPSISAVWAALVGGQSLPSDVVATADIEALLATAALAVIPRSAAAASPDDGSAREIERRVDGVRVRIVPSRAGPEHRFLTVTFQGPGSTATRLYAVVDGRTPVDVALPPPVSGSVQLLVDTTDPILAALTDPDSRLYLV